MLKILLRILVSAAALGVAAWVVPGIVLTGHDTAAKVLTLLIVAVIFGLINVLLKPIIKTVGCAFYVLTLGLVAIVVNGLLLWLTSYIAYDKLHEPFHITGFVAALEGALIVGVVTWVLHLIIGDDEISSATRGGRPPAPCCSLGDDPPCTPRHGRASPPISPHGRTPPKTRRPRAAAGVQKRGAPRAAAGVRAKASWLKRVAWRSRLFAGCRHARGSGHGVQPERRPFEDREYFAPI